MAYAINVPNGILCMIESKVECPYCAIHMPIDEFEDAFYKSDNPTIRKKCKGCHRFIGIAQNIVGDYVGFELLNSKY